MIKQLVSNIGIFHQEIESFQLASLPQRPPPITIMLEHIRRCVVIGE